MIKIYTASTLKHAPLWVALRDQWPEIEFTARWPVDHMVGDKPKWAEDEPFARIFWQHDLADVTAADLVLCYGDADEKLQGALVEAGMALGQGKQVICVGHSPSFGTWQFHPNVFCVDDLIAARNLLALMAIS